MNNPQAKKKLTSFLLICYDALKVYGKEPEQLDNVNKLFQLILAEYEYPKIEEAFRYYLKYNNELPAPADIVSIIERGNKPPFERTVYLSLVKRKAADPYAYNVLTREEEAYIKDYERWTVTGKN